MLSEPAASRRVVAVTGEEVVGARSERWGEAVPVAVLDSVFDEPDDEAAEDMLSKAREGRKGERAREGREGTAEEGRLSDVGVDLVLRGNEAGVVVRK